MKYRKKPVVIDAWEWDEKKSTLKEIGCRLTSCRGHRDKPDLCADLRIDTLEGAMSARKGDFIIKDIKGEYYPCKPDIFAKTYEKVAQKKGEAPVTIDNTDIPKCKTCKHADKSKRESNCIHNYTAGTKGCFALRKYL